MCLKCAVLSLRCLCALVCALVWTGMPPQRRSGKPGALVRPSLAHLVGLIASCYLLSSLCCSCVHMHVRATSILLAILFFACRP
jgi:hypothetical protein